MNRVLLSLFLILIIGCQSINAQHSIAREWNEVLLESIRLDLARPTVHARNLFHISIAMYDAWAVYDAKASTYLLGQTVQDFPCAFDGILLPQNKLAAQQETLSYAVYRIFINRFRYSNNYNAILKPIYDNFMFDKGYDPSFTSPDYSNSSPAALGNYLAQQIIAYGMQDESNQISFHTNLYYDPVNLPIIIEKAGNEDLSNYNRWQPVSLRLFIDQSGNEIAGNVQPFLSPEWGGVSPFALNSNDMNSYFRDNFEYKVYHDPGMPPLCDTLSGLKTLANLDEYKWGFTLVARWAAHLDANDNTMWDISPASIGNIQSYPTDFNGMKNFYDFENGGDASQGHAINPATNMPYTPQMVKRGDYGRVLAEFWADGPDSETPPGHWFTLLNYVNDHPNFEKRYEGTGDIIEDFEWDVKAYLTLGGAMHDAAITAWGCKGWYDYIRPVSVIRCMGDNGQCSNPTLSNYSPAGLPLIPGFIEVVETNDPLVGVNNEHLGKMKIYTWKGPDYINDPASDEAGVDWILAENWWPYQRPTFVTPPFAGYVSGHSTFSRAAAEIMTSLTGDAFFPGGMGEFNANKNEFLVFEEGPSEDIILQWATYRDASDQCSLSRIWGGIHPPADDMPGRLMGIEVGNDAFDKAKNYTTGKVCVAHRIISENNLLSGDYTANSTIQSNAKIDNQAQVNYAANDTITLINGFEVEAGVDFYANLGVCN